MLSRREEPDELGPFQFGILVLSLVLLLGLLAEAVFTIHPEIQRLVFFIHTAEDALWWSIVTTTTVGYGDHYPITTAGRIIATFLMITGIGLFGTLSGVAAGIFLGSPKAQPVSPDAQRTILDRLDALQHEIHELRENSPPNPPSANAPVRTEPAPSPPPPDQ